MPHIILCVLLQSDGNGDHARSGQVLSGNADMERLQAENKELRDKLDVMNATVRLVDCFYAFM